VIARALGAEVIERHITLDKDMWGSDHKASLNPEELEELIDILNNVDKWIGKLGIRCYPSEEKVKKKLRKE
jgi:sialic acid synthase SpsE